MNTVCLLSDTHTHVLSRSVEQKGLCPATAGLTPLVLLMAQGLTYDDAYLTCPRKGGGGEGGGAGFC